ncbi:hypothetical protein DL93DRAFT_783111 [Clavulina sp. PMI_390]|nr:hypothetical protein DL93DRAFT_783111 [Clavulina sp. PMI_390]
MPVEIGWKVVRHQQPVWDVASSYLQARRDQNIDHHHSPATFPLYHLVQEDYSLYRHPRSRGIVGRRRGFRSRHLGCPLAFSWQARAHEECRGSSPQDYWSGECRRHRPPLQHLCIRSQRPQLVSLWSCACHRTHQADYTAGDAEVMATLRTRKEMRTSGGLVRLTSGIVDTRPMRLDAPPPPTGLRIPIESLVLGDEDDDEDEEGEEGDEDDWEDEDDEDDDEVEVEDELEPSPPPPPSRKRKAMANQSTESKRKKPLPATTKKPFSSAAKGKNASVESGASEAYDFKQFF